MKKIFISFLLLLISFASQAGLFPQSKSKFLPVDQAFIFSAVKSSDFLHLNWQIAENYYLYKKGIQLQYHDQSIFLNFPKAESYEDEFFGEVEIFRNELVLAASLEQLPRDAELNLTYQGCTQGFCYPPETKTIALQTLLETEKTPENNTAHSTPLESQNWSIFWFFVLGLGLAFTPCVLPMLPLLSVIVIGNKNRPTLFRALGLSIVYVQGMALTYAVLGLIVVAFGLPFQIALQSPIVLISLSLLFVLLSLSMFGVYELQLPIKWQNKLTTLSQKQQTGTFAGVFVMGMLAGLVASPCTSAPLSGVLFYVAQTGDMLIGGISLYLLALGMGLPLVLVTLFGNKILPKSGNWLISVKELFGFILLLLPVILLSRVFVSFESELWAIWLIVFCAWIVRKHFLTGIIVALITFFSAIYFFPNTFHFSSNQYKQSAVLNSSVLHTSFQRISTLEDLDLALKNNTKSMVMVDFYADWCVACKEFERETFADPKVQQAFEDILLLQFDMTKNSPENTKILNHFQILGLPTILFFDHQRKEISNGRITGFIKAEEFLMHLRKIGQ